LAIAANKKLTTDCSDRQQPMNNIEQFSLYTAIIFHHLYEDFPIPISLDKQEIISNYVFFDKDEELRELQTKVSFSELAEMTDDDILKQKVKDKIPKIKDELSKLEFEKQAVITMQENIYNGTLEFLISEGLVNTPEP